MALTEQDLQKTVVPEVEKKQLEDTTKDKEDDKLKEGVRKGEIFIAETPYGNETENKSNELSQKELKKKHEQEWTRLVWGR